MMFIPLLVFILLAFFVFRNTDLPRDQIPKHTERTPLDILKRRYAEGDISQEEFLRMREELTKRN